MADWRTSRMLHHHPLHGIPRYDELEHLRMELDQEERLKESLDWSNGELERSINELEQYVRELEDNTKGVDDNEWKVRYESQVAMNKQLAEHKDWLETELAEARRKLTTGSYPEAMNFNLDALNEVELLRLVKHLERMRNDFYSTLRDTEWKLDKESKEFHHFDEMRRVYKSDLKHANSQLERMKVSLVDPAMYPPGYFRWIDSQTPGPARSKSKSPSRTARTSKAGGSKQKEQRSPSRSPTRSKSRAEKKPKKREETPPEEATTTQKSETENENPSEEEEEEEEEDVGESGVESPPRGSPSKGSPSKGSPSKGSPSKKKESSPRDSLGGSKEQLQEAASPARKREPSKERSNE